MLIPPPRTPTILSGFTALHTPATCTATRHGVIGTLLPDLTPSAVAGVMESIVLESRALMLLLEGRHKSPEGPQVEITGRDLVVWCIRCQTRVSE